MPPLFLFCDEQFEFIKNIENFISQIREANFYGKEINEWLFTCCYKGSTGSIIQNAQEKYKLFREKLIAIDGCELGSNIITMKNVHNNKMINVALDNIESSYKQIYSITKLQDEISIVNNFSACLNYFDDITNQYRKIILLIQYVNLINTDLSKGIEEVPLRIRSL
ncbi:hypothetical protein [Clostridium sp.]|uniref:hypothetical protein n=1 Tax=Clostridium sp. TaxID=1506 RepID=UPI00284A9351|nr:hypothetical protein [Clostridium sp.]MDR3595824.1 hypothetical protein [Clostridium sp.]